MVKDVSLKRRKSVDIMKPKQSMLGKATFGGQLYNVHRDNVMQENVMF